MNKVKNILRRYFIFTALFLASVISITNCSGEPEKMNLTAAEGFAYPLDSGWEFNGLVQVDGFTQIEDSLGNYLSSVSYFANLITSDKDTIERVDFGTVSDTSDDEILNMQINFQIELDSNFSTGGYDLLIFAEDNNSVKRDTTSLQFSLSAF